MKTDVGLKIIALVFFLAAGQPVLADEDAGKDAYVDSLMSIVRPMRDRGRLVPAAQEFMDFLDREGFTDGKIICYLQHPNGCFFAKLFPCFIR